MAESVRIDKWLWAARFFKTRKLAREAILGGKVRIYGHRVKPGRQLNEGDVLLVSRGEDDYEITVLDTGGRRLSAPLAQQKYTEDPESIRKREAAAEARRLAHAEHAERPRRPDKRQRRQIVRFTRKKD